MKKKLSGKIIQWKSDVSKENKTVILPSSCFVSTTVWHHLLDLTKRLQKRLDVNYTSILPAVLNIWMHYQQNSGCTVTSHQYYTPFHLGNQDMLDSVGKVKRNSRDSILWAST